MRSRLRATGATLREIRKLHAKIYANESEALVSSLNLTDSAFDNVEVSVRLRGQGALAQIRRILTGLVAGQGHCIRCGQGIAFNVDQPHCADCFEAWAEYENADYGEKCCHRCGKSSRTTRRKPLCEVCFAEPG